MNFQSDQIRLIAFDLDGTLLNSDKVLTPRNRAALEIMTYLDQFPIVYDCYKDNTGWMTQSMWDQAEVFAPNAYYVHSIRTNRKPGDRIRGRTK